MLTEFVVVVVVAVVKLANALMPIALTVVVALPGVEEVLATQRGDVTGQQPLLYFVALPQA